MFDIGYQEPEEVRNIHFLLGSKNTECIKMKPSVFSNLSVKIFLECFISSVTTFYDTPSGLLLSGVPTAWGLHESAPSNVYRRRSFVPQRRFVEISTLLGARSIAAGKNANPIENETSIFDVGRSDYIHLWRLPL